MNLKPPSVCILVVEQRHGSGAERVLEYMLLAMVGEINCRLTVCSPQGSSVYQYARNLGYEVVAWPAKRDSAIENFKAASKVMASWREMNFDIIHAWTARDFEIVLLLSKMLHCRCSGTLHDHPQAKFHGWIRQKLIHYSARQLAALVCVSEALATVCQTNGLGQSVVIHNGLPPEPAVSSVVADKMKIGFLGGQSNWKGAAVVKEWVTKTQNQPLEWHWFGNLSSTWQMELSNIGVICHGRLPTKEIYSFLDCVAHPSVDFDPYPTVLLETARAGLPVVASDMGGSHEIVLHGETGFLFDGEQPYDGLAYLQTLAGDNVLRTQLGRNARIKYEREMSVQFMKNAYLDLWEKIMVGGKV